MKGEIGEIRFLRAVAGCGVTDRKHNKTIAGKLGITEVYIAIMKQPEETSRTFRNNA
jgi:hypothetical protein